MATIHNQITINASIDKIWQALATTNQLDKFDPTVKKSIATTQTLTGLGASRKVDMLDGKNWFEEKITVFDLEKALTYELTACSFPIKKLKHTYTFEPQGQQTVVKQVMQYQVKYGLLGKILDRLVIRNQSDAGIKKFFGGLKQYVEGY